MRLLLLAHVIGALKHHYVDKDGVLSRMLPGNRYSDQTRPWVSSKRSISSSPRYVPVWTSMIPRAQTVVGKAILGSNRDAGALIGGERRNIVATGHLCLTGDNDPMLRPMAMALEESSAPGETWMCLTEVVADRQTFVPAPGPVDTASG